MVNHCADMPTYFSNIIMTQEVWMLYSIMITSARPRECWGKWSPDSLSSLSWSQIKTWLDRYTGPNFPTVSTKKNGNCVRWRGAESLLVLILCHVFHFDRGTKFFHTFWLRRKVQKRKGLCLSFRQERASGSPLHVAPASVKCWRKLFI